MPFQPRRMAPLGLLSGRFRPRLITCAADGVTWSRGKINLKGHFKVNRNIGGKINCFNSDRGLLEDRAQPLARIHCILQHLSRTHTHTYIHTYIHTCMLHKYIHTYIHTYTHMPLPSCNNPTIKGEEHIRPAKTCLQIHSNANLEMHMHKDCLGRPPTLSADESRAVHDKSKNSHLSIFTCGLIHWSRL